jgi:hypothetical protein
MTFQRGVHRTMLVHYGWKRETVTEKQKKAKKKAFDFGRILYTLKF